MPDASRGAITRPPITRDRLKQMVYQELAAFDEEDYARLGHFVPDLMSALTAATDRLRGEVEAHGYPRSMCHCEGCKFLRGFDEVQP